jgi:hypothetical protein
VPAIFERRRGRLGSKISGYGQLVEVAVYFAMSGLPSLGSRHQSEGSAFPLGVIRVVLTPDPSLPIFAGKQTFQTPVGMFQNVPKPPPFLTPSIVDDSAYHWHALERQINSQSKALLGSGVRPCRLK